MNQIDIRIFQDVGQIKMIGKEKKSAMSCDLIE